MQRGFEEFRLEADHYWRHFSPLRGVTVEVMVTPRFPSHRRSYIIITTDRPIDVADGGFAISAERDGLPYSEDMVEWTRDGVTARFPWAVSGIRCEEGGGSPMLVKAWPNTDLLHPLTRIPTIRRHLLLSRPHRGKHRGAHHLRRLLPPGVCSTTEGQGTF